MWCCNNKLRASQQRRIDEDPVLVDANQPAVQLSAVFWRRRGVAAWMIVTNNDCRTIAYDSRSIDFSGT
jgi:hypothetical protein